MTPKRKLLLLCGLACALWALSVVAFFLTGLYGKSGGEYPELVLLAHLSMAMVYGLASAFVGGFLLGSVTAILNEAGFFAPLPRNGLRSWTLQLMLFTGVAIAGIGFLLRVAGCW